MQPTIDVDNFRDEAENPPTWWRTAKQLHHDRIRSDSTAANPNSEIHNTTRRHERDLLPLCSHEPRPSEPSRILRRRR